ncbi:MAG: STAS domain-containing protein [Magnetococcales bacterium]|nr:STAS domain-containing protein [Magnetococcales bacterium]
MSGSISAQQSEGGLLICVQGRFNCEMHLPFRATYEGKLSHKQEIVVDLAATEYIDSAALGMLLHLREQANTHESSVHLIHVPPDVRHILEASHFQRLFKISS